MRAAEDSATDTADRATRAFERATDEIEEELISRTSIMPDNVGSLLKERECHDLLAYLVSLRAKPKTPALDQEVSGRP